MMMKKIPLVILFSLLLIGTASAYMVNVDAPSTLTKGDVLTANATSNFPAGIRLSGMSGFNDSPPPVGVWLWRGCFRCRKPVARAD